MGVRLSNIVLRVDGGDKAQKTLNDVSRAMSMNQMELKKLEAAYGHSSKDMDYLAQRSDPGAALDECFETVREQGFHLLRPTPDRRLSYMDTIQALEAALRSQEFGAQRLSDLLCQQLMIGLNRDLRSSATAREAPESYRVDQKIEEILRYIAENLQEDLSVEALSKRFFLSRYYLMHRFKAVTGYTLHQYIRQKRILRAGELLRAGTPVMKAAEQVGYTEYSTFLRAFQATFHVSPRDFQ